MSYRYSFRMARQDTYQFCDSRSKQLRNIEKALPLQVAINGRKQKHQELIEIKLELDTHLKESELRYGALDYDIRVLAKSGDHN